jgi:hypothetical protein
MAAPKTEGTTTMRTLFLTTATFAALVMIAPVGKAHADLDAWTKEHGRQFEARWHGHAGGKQWQKEMVKFCQEGFMHDYDIGVFDAVSTAERLKDCDGWAR